MGSTHNRKRDNYIHEDTMRNGVAFGGDSREKMNRKNAAKFLNTLLNYCLRKVQNLYDRKRGENINLREDEKA